MLSGSFIKQFLHWEARYSIKSDDTPRPFGKISVNHSLLDDRGKEKTARLHGKGYVVSIYIWNLIPWSLLCHLLRKIYLCQLWECWCVCWFRWDRGVERNGKCSEVEWRMQKILITSLLELKIPTSKAIHRDIGWNENENIPLQNHN